MPASVPRIAILLGAFVLALAGCGSGSGQRAAPTATTPSAGARPAYLRTVRTGDRPCAVLGAAGAIWVADLIDTHVSRLNPATGKATATIRTGIQPCGMAYGAGSVWVENYGANSVTRIDVRTLRTRTYRVGASPYDVTFAAGAAWVTNYGDDTVTRIDAASGKTKQIPVGASPEGIAKAAGAVWVADNGDGTVTRIDTRTLRVRKVKIGGSPAWTAYAGSTIWVGDQADGQVVRINARTGTAVARIKVGPTPNDGDVLGKYVWFPDKSGALYRISRTSNQASGPYPLHAANPFTLAAYDGRLWIANFGGTDVLIVNPAKVPR